MTEGFVKAPTSEATQTCPGVSGSLSELLKLGISMLEEDMVRALKKRCKIGRNRQLARPLGYIYTIFGLEASLAGLSRQAAQ
jgi:hypothetical protein